MSGSKLPNPTSAVPRAENQDQPLGMTIHTLPKPEGVAQADARRTAMGRVKMLLVLLICAAPVIASYFTYYVLRPEGRRNFGELIQPQRTMPSWTLQSARDGAPQALQTLKGQWLLVVVADAACGPLCENQLYLQRQLREGLGRDKDRLDRVWLVTDTAPVRTTLWPALSEASVLRVSPSELAQWLAPEASHQLEDHLYVVDPMGNWMMRFPANLDKSTAAKARKDLERLMRASASWDQAGRQK